MFAVLFPADLDSPGVAPEGRQQPVDLGVAAGQPVDALGHDAVAVDKLDTLVNDDRDVLVGHLLLPEHVAVVEGDFLKGSSPGAALLLGTNQDVERSIVEVTDQDRVFGEALGQAEVLAVLPDEEVFGLLEVDVLQLGAVRGGVAEVLVGQGKPGEAPLRSKAWGKYDGGGGGE